MFRRKEDSLFDNTTDPNQAQVESANVVAPQQASAPAPAAQAPSAPAAQQAPAAPQQHAHSSSQQAAPAMRQPQPASSFRPSPAASAPIGGDLSRRMPEAKSSVSNNPAAAAAGNADKSVKTPRRVLTVGNDILLKGEIATCDRLVIEGKVDASLNDVHTVEIAETGSFKGSANIEDAEISGLFEGDLVVRNRLVIYATGKVRGKITYGEIEIERGGELTGDIKSGTSTAAAPAGRTSSPARAKADDKVAA